MIPLRLPLKEDDSQIKALVKEAFEKSPYGYNNENDIIEKVHKTDLAFFFEIVAVSDEKIVGYGLLSPAFVGKTTGLVLAPLAVLPSHQGQGIGKKIIEALEEKAVKEGFPFIHILGDPNYYGKFGYLPARNYHIQAPFDVEEKYFLIKDLTSNHLKDLSGTLYYSPIFD